MTTNTWSRYPYYRDANSNGTGKASELLGTDTDGTDGWSTNATVTWALGSHTFMGSTYYETPRMDSLAHDLDVRKIGEESRQIGSGQALIVDDEHTE